MIIAILGMMISPMMPLQAQGVAEDDILATWINAENDTLETYKVGDKFFTKIVGLKEPIDAETGMPKLDKNNPDPNLRTRPIKGLIFLIDCKYDSGEWGKGSYYDYIDGKTWKCKLWFNDEANLDLLSVKTYRTFGSGKTTYWTKKKTN